VLNASITELAMRTSAHVYGGGIYNLSPGSVGAIPVVDVRRLSASALQQLEATYGQFLHSGGKDRPLLDAAVLAVLEMPPAFLTTLQEALHSMQGLSNAVLAPVTTALAEGTGWPEELRLL
jgi:hypothetical protein